MSKLKRFFNDRKRELSTWTIGLPFLVMGLSELLKINEGEAIADAVSTAGQNYVESGDWRTGAATLGIGLLGAFGSFGKKRGQ